MTQLDNAICIQHVKKGFGQKSVLKDVSFEVQPGELVALLGENGAGKTTLISIVLGLLDADQGDVSVVGHLPGSAQAKQKIGVMLQAASLPEKLKVIEQIQLFASYFERPRDIDEVIALAKIERIRNDFISVLSGGQKQRLLFALSLIGNPQILILDEPTVGLDSDSRRVFWDCIEQLKSQGTAIILTTHYLDEAEALADRVVLLHDGNVVLNDSTDAIKAQIQVREVRLRSDINFSQLQSLFPNIHIEMQGATFVFQTSSPESLLRTLIEKGVAFSDLVVTPISLERAVNVISNQTTHTQQGEAA